MELENKHLWPRIWHLGGLTAELEEPGDIGDARIGADGTPGGSGENAGKLILVGGISKTHGWDAATLLQMLAHEIREPLQSAGQAMQGAVQVLHSIKTLALEHGLISAYTAFLAVDATRKTEGAYGTSIAVPVPTPGLNDVPVELPVPATPATA